MMTDTQKKVYNLVSSVAEKVKTKDKEIKLINVINRCQSIIYNEWGVGTQELWDSVEKYADEIVRMTTITFEHEKAFGTFKTSKLINFSTGDKFVFTVECIKGLFYSGEVDIVLAEHSEANGSLEFFDYKILEFIIESQGDADELIRLIKDEFNFDVLVIE